MVNGMPSLFERISLVCTARITGLEKILVTFSFARYSASSFACILPRSVSGCFQPILEKMPSTLASDWAWRTKKKRSIAVLNLYSSRGDEGWQGLPQHAGRVNVFKKPGQHKASCQLTADLLVQGVTPLVRVFSASNFFSFSAERSVTSAYGSFLVAMSSPASIFSKSKM